MYRRHHHLPLFSLLSILLTLASCNPAQKLAGPGKGELIPDFQLATLEGEELDSASLYGDIVVLNFWATWCGPCVKEIPDLRAIEDAGQARVVAISLDENAKEVLPSFVAKHKINYTVLLGETDTGSQFGVWALPYTLVLDQESQVFRTYTGKVTQSTLEKDIQRLRQAQG